MRTCNNLQESRFESEMPTPHGIMFKHLVLNWWYCFKGCGTFRRWSLIRKWVTGGRFHALYPNPISLEFPLLPGTQFHSNLLPQAVTGQPAFPP